MKSTRERFWHAARKWDMPFAQIFSVGPWFHIEQIDFVLWVLEQEPDTLVDKIDILKYTKRWKDASNSNVAGSKNRSGSSRGSKSISDRPTSTAG